jgi:hypothetical protein
MLLILSFGLSRKAVLLHFSLAVFRRLREGKAESDSEGNAVRAEERGVVEETAIGGGLAVERRLVFDALEKENILLICGDPDPTQERISLAAVILGNALLKIKFCCHCLD